MRSAGALGIAVPVALEIRRRLAAPDDLGLALGHDAIRTEHVEHGVVRLAVEHAAARRAVTLAEGLHQGPVVLAQRLAHRRYSSSSSRVIRRASACSTLTGSS